MKPDQWERIKELFQCALELPPHERARMLSEACNQNDPARLEVERLLREYDLAGSFMDIPPLPALLSAHPPGDVRTFAESEIVAGRFRIVRFIGEGGMGEVYEAEDLDLHERVALKTVRPVIATDGKSLEALKREIHHARKVTHPNVNRIFDLERHQYPGGGEVAFLTMELLAGETLAEHLKRDGSMTAARAWPLIEQMAAGLGAAHKAGIVHRDFKPGNVMLIGTETPRAVVTDFGLSRAVDAGAVNGEPFTGSVSGVAGTAPYIAPEQLEGGPVTPATDVFALGVVLYEMLTGAQAFPGQSPLSVALKRLNEPPTPPRAHVPTMDVKWQTAILRCLERRPADRFQSTADVVAALRGEPPARTSRARFRWALVAGFSLALFAAALGWLYLRIRLPEAALGIPVQLTNDLRQKRGEIAVADGSWLYFEERVGFRTILAKASFSLGQTQELRTQFQNVYLLDSSPDRAELLVATSDTAYARPSAAMPIWRLPTAGGAARRVGRVTASAATWSPDGNRIAYAAGFNLWTVDADGHDPKRIHTAPGKIQMIRWSPDGGTLAFETDSPERRPIEWEIRPDGSGLKRWAPESGGLRLELQRGPAWTPDGRYFLADARDDTWLVPARSTGLDWILRSKPMPLHLGIGSRLLGISLDSKTAYVINSGPPRSELSIYDRSRQDVVRLTQFSAISAATPAFSPDGAWIAYADDNANRLWRSKADGTGLLALTSVQLGAGLPAWSPDGKQIAFMGSVNGEPSRIYTVARDGGNPKLVVPESLWKPLPVARDGWQGGPSWSPDGKQIAFGENCRQFPLPLTCAIHIFNRETQRLSTILKSDGLWTARWSPTGRYLAALTRDDEKLMLYDFRNHKWTTLDGGFIGDNPAWSQDGRYLYYLKPFANPPSLMRMRVPGGEPQRVADLSVLDKQRGSFTLWSSLAPGDIPMLIRRDYNDEIFSCDLKLPQ